MASFKAQLGSVKVGDNEPVAVMGIINLDPHSFYRSSSYDTIEEAVSAIEIMIAEEVDIIDVGGASTAPGAPAVSVEKEKSRVIPLIKIISRDWDIPISIDTQHASVAEVALANGVTIVNDVSGLKSDINMVKVIQDTGASCVIMATRNQPGDCSTIPEIIMALQQSTQIALKGGVSKNRIVVDPGIGFGKPYESDLKILYDLRKIRVLRQPILLGVSRKNFIGKVLNYSSPQDRLYGTLAATSIGLMKGIHVIRTHDIRATLDCVKLVRALLSAQRSD